MAPCFGGIAFADSTAWAVPWDRATGRFQDQILAAEPDDSSLMVAAVKDANTGFLNLLAAHFGDPNKLIDVAAAGAVSTFTNNGRYVRSAGDQMAIAWCQQLAEAQAEAFADTIRQAADDK